MLPFEPLLPWATPLQAGRRPTRPSWRVRPTRIQQKVRNKRSRLRVKHIRYFRTLRLEGELLSEAYLAFAPAALDSDMRGIADALRAECKMGDPEEAKLRATRRVAAAADPALEHALRLISS